MLEGQKGKMDGEQHSHANSSCETPKRQDLPFMGTRDQHSAQQEAEFPH